MNNNNPKILIFNFQQVSMKRLLMLFLTGLCAVSLQLNAQTGTTVATDGGITPPTDVSSVPVVSTASASESTKDVKKDADKAKEEEQRKSVNTLGSYPNAYNGLPGVPSNSQPLYSGVSNLSALTTAEAHLTMFAGVPPTTYPNVVPLGTQTLVGGSNASSTSVLNGTSYPSGYATNHNPVSTGYYLMDNMAAQYGAPWQPTYQFLDITGSLASRWRRIASGPFQNSSIPFTPAPPGPFGVEYFRNPRMVLPSLGDPCPLTPGASAPGYDSTDDAFAGPLSIGFPFYYYGVKYDSFYVSTNGLIMLSNRRYKYDALGSRVDYEPFGDNPQRPLWTNLPGINPTPAQIAQLTQDVDDNYGYLNALTMLSGLPGSAPSATNVNFPATSTQIIPTTTVAGLTNITNSGALGVAQNIIVPNGAMATDRAAWRSIIAPLWDDCELPQVLPDASGAKPVCGTGTPSPIGEVYWTIDPTGNQMTIYYKNLAMVARTKTHAFTCTSVTPGYNVIKADVQITLDRSDSTVTFNYISFVGTVPVFPPPPASAMFRANSTIGIQGSDLINNDNGLANIITGTAGTGNTFSTVKNGVAGGNSRQFTRYSFNDCPNPGGVFVDGDPSSTPSAGMAIKFKQWKNVARILNVKYNVPDYTQCDPRVPTTVLPAPNNFIIPASTFNFELLLGHPVLGVMQPQGTVQNLTADTRLGNLFFQNPNISPAGIGTTWSTWNATFNPSNPIYSSNSLGNLEYWVNNLPQPVSFNVTFRILDLVTFGNVPYQNSQRTTNLFPISYNSAVEGPPYSIGAAGTPNFQVMLFPPYITNATMTNQLGRFRAEMFVEDISPLGARYGEQWPFDDTSSQLLFGIRREEIPYINTFSDYSNSFVEGPIPNVQKWVSIGASVTDGESNTYDPPSPRGPQGALNINSPLVLIDRRDFNGVDYSGSQIGATQQTLMGQNPPQSNYPLANPAIGGDILISFPINLSSVTTRPVVNLSYQRSGVNTYNRAWSDNSRIGTEQLIVATDQNSIPWNAGLPDNLVVEFARPSVNGCNRMTNVGVPFSGSVATMSNNQTDWNSLAYTATGNPFGDIRGGGALSTSPNTKWQNGLILGNVGTAVAGSAAQNTYTLYPTGTQIATPYPRWGVIGGGGGSRKPTMVGSTVVLNETDTNGYIVLDNLDPGKDFEFYRVRIPIPSAHYQEFSWAARFMPATPTANPIYNDLSAKYFRFRIRGASRNHRYVGTPPPLPPSGLADDNDPFFVDNVTLTEPLYPEIEVVKVAYDWPFTEAPASQAKQIPLKVKVFNNGANAATAFGMSLQVENLDVPPPPGFFSYYRYKSVIALLAGTERWETYPAWNAQECGAKITPTNPNQSTLTNYRITAKIADSYEENFSPSIASRNCVYCGQNNTQYTDFPLRLGPTYAYDPASSPSGTNDVPTLSTYPGKGLNTLGTFEDGVNESPYGAASGIPFTTGRLGSGSFAANFPIYVTDTVKGFTAYYGSMNQSPDEVTYLLYRNNPGQAPSAVILPSKRPAKRGQGFRMNGAQVADPNYPYTFDEYVTFLLDTPVVLTPGNYYVAVEQMGEDGIELGGSGYHMGQVTTVTHPATQIPPPSPGVPNVSPAIYRDLGGLEKFWFSNNTSSYGASWFPLMRDRGNPGYPHLNWSGQDGSIALLGSGQIYATATFSRASWIPMIKPYFGSKVSNDCTVLPVELTEFNLTELSDALRLDWKTASETNNFGYNVERRIKGETAWADAINGFVKGNGTTNVPQSYNFVDANVERDVTYEYRLRQVDIDGTTNHTGIREGRLTSVKAGEISTLEQNVPNPVSTNTTFGVKVAEAGKYNIEITDVFGKSVRNLEFIAEGGKRTNIQWDATDANGNLVPAGNYIYKLVGKGVVSGSRKMTVVR